MRVRSVAETGSTPTSFGSMKWMANAEVTGTDITLGRVVIEAGKQNERHKHPSAQEVLYLLAGSLAHTLGDEEVVMEAGDTVVIPPDTFHNARSVGDVDADMIVAYSSGNRGYVSETGNADE
jgi:quercetin dioxygenase-like cupin family protein